MAETKSILARLHTAASLTNSARDRERYSAAADKITVALSDLKSLPTNDAMRDLNCGWAHATRLLLNPLAGGDTPPNSGDTDATRLAA